MAMSKNNLWINKNFEKLVENHAGRCVAIIDGKVIAVASDQMTAYRKASQKYPNKKPTVLRIPRKRELVCALNFRIRIITD